METFLHFDHTTPIEGPEFFSALNFSTSPPPKETNFIKTELVVVVDGSTGQVGSAWDPGTTPNPNPTFKFKSKSGRQFLIVNLDSPIDPVSGNPLFHIDHITCAEGHQVRQIHHTTTPTLGNTKHPLIPCAPGTQSIAIEFGMSKTDDTFPFKLSVFVRKHGTTEIHDADPQVGNDPPKPTIDQPQVGNAPP